MQRETGRRGDGETGRRGDGETDIDDCSDARERGTGRGDGETGRQGDRETGERDGTHTEMGPVVYYFTNKPLTD